MIFFLWTLGPAILLALGNILQKIGLSHVAQSQQPQGWQSWCRHVLRNLPWWGGMGLSAIATLLYYGALSRYNISLVQPMMAFNPVLTALIGWLYLKEHIELRTIIAILLIVGGLICAGTQGQEALGYENPVYLGSFFFFWVLVIMISRVFVLQFEVRKSLIGGVGFGMAAIFVKSLSLYLQSHAISPVSGAALADLGLILRFLAFLLCYFTGFFYTQAALSRGRALFVVPFSAALGMLIPALAGFLVFQEPAGPLKLGAVALVALGSALFIRLR